MTLFCFAFGSFRLLNVIRCKYAHSFTSEKYRLWLKKNGIRKLNTPKADAQYDSFLFTCKQDCTAMTPVHYVHACEPSLIIYNIMFNDTSTLCSSVCSFNNYNIDRCNCTPHITKKNIVFFWSVILQSTGCVAPALSRITELQQIAWLQGSSHNPR
jgi:hypothetical protein